MQSSLYTTYSLRSKIRVTFYKIRGLKVMFRTFSTKLCVLHSSHLAFSGELGVSIGVSKSFGVNFSRSPPFWVDDAEAHKTALICVDAVESKYQLLNNCKVFLTW
jgi:hypothetical protein